MSFNKRKKILTLEIDEIRKDVLMDLILTEDYKNEQPYLCFANVHMCMETYWDRSIREAVNNAKYIVGDGVPIVVAMRLLYRINQERIAGMDFMPDLMEAAERNHESIFFYGSTDKTLHKIVKKARKDYPDLIIAGMMSPPFRNLTDEENRDHIRFINESGAKYIFIGLGCPKQELWMAANHQKINGVMFGVGAAFDVYAGTKKMAPEWMRRIGIEWIFRLLQDPRRLFKRYFLTNTTFLFLIFIEFIKIRVFKIIR